MIWNHTTYTSAQLGRTTLAALGAATMLAVLTADASAALIFNSVRFDAHVRSGNGSGGTAGVEKHLTNHGFPPIDPTNVHPSNYHPLPAVDPILPGSLQRARDLELRLLPWGGAPHADNANELWITNFFADGASGEIGGTLVENHLDNTLATPVELEMWLYDDDLPDGHKLVFPAFELQGQAPPTLLASQYVEISDNIGSHDDPIRVLLKFTQRINGVGHIPVVNGEVVGDFKLPIYWETMEMDTPEVPEPATIALVALGVLGVAGLARRPRR